MRYFFLFALFISSIFAEEPWGKDSALTRPPRRKIPFSSSPALFLIRFHQEVISKADGPRSHFYPSSSEYMRRALHEWKGSTGFILGCDRLLRENSDLWCYRKVKIGNSHLKWDPVPLPQKP
jgi:uncharacterized protein